MLTSQPVNAPRKSPKHLLNRRLGGSRAIRTFRRRQKSPTTAGIVTPDCPAHSLVNIPTMPSTYVSTLNDTHNSIFKFSKRPSKVRTALFWAITQYSLCNSQEECRSHLLRGGGLNYVLLSCQILNSGFCVTTLLTTDRWDSPITVIADFSRLFESWILKPPTAVLHRTAELSLCKTCKQKRSQ